MACSRVNFNCYRDFQFELLNKYSYKRKYFVEPPIISLKKHVNATSDKNSIINGQKYTKRTSGAAQNYCSQRSVVPAVEVSNNTCTDLDRPGQALKVPGA